MSPFDFGSPLHLFYSRVMNWMSLQVFIFLFLCVCVFLTQTQKKNRK